MLKYMYKFIQYSHARVNVKSAWV